MQGELEAEKPSLGGLWGKANCSKEMEEQEITRYTWENNCKMWNVFLMVSSTVRFKQLVSNSIEYGYCQQYM